MTEWPSIWRIPVVVVTMRMSVDTWICLLGPTMTLSSLCLLLPKRNDEGFVLNEQHSLCNPVSDGPSLLDST